MYPLISVIIPVYNVEEYLPKCIESVISQSYKDLEILLINDGSQDASGSICEKYQMMDNRIKVIHKKNSGLSDVRNLGIDISKGDYIMFLDSDDYWEGDFLYDLANYTRTNNLDYIFFRYKSYYQKTNRIEEPYLYCQREKIKGKEGAECLEYILHHNKKHNWYAWLGIIYRKFIIENNLYFQKGRTYEDVMWTPKVFLTAKKVDYYDKAVYVYRQERDGQITSKLSYINLLDSIYVASYWEERISEYSIRKKLKISLLNNVCKRYHVAIRYSGFLNKENKGKLIVNLKSKRELLKYNNDLVGKITRILCNTVGFNVTSLIFKNLITIKKRINIFD